MFLLQSADGSNSGDQLGQITLPQFRSFMHATKTITAKFTPDKVRLAPTQCGCGRARACTSIGHGLHGPERMRRLRRHACMQVDEIFTAVATSEQTLLRKMDLKGGVSTFDLLDFMLALIHVAAHR